jgi:hypothetical protein
MQKKCANEECVNKIDEKPRQRKYCSRKCCDRVSYLKHRDKKIRKAKEYCGRNKEKTELYQSGYRLEHKEKTKEYDRNRVKTKSRLKIDYGITLADWEGMLTKQEGRCAICGIHQSELKRGLAVDHNHNTGIVRGLLCHRCNIGIGYFHDDAELIKKSIAYLEKEK